MYGAGEFRSDGLFADGCEAGRMRRPAWMKPIDRFNEKFKIAESGCWEWQQGKKEEYGKFFDGKQVGAHRWSYQYFIGAIPENHFICHTCDNPKCVNPEHLFAGTSSDNQIDYHLKGNLKIKHFAPMSWKYNKRFTKK